MEHEKIATALKSGNLKLVSSSGFQMPVNPLRNKPKVSNEWGFHLSFDELCEKSLYGFRSSGGRDNQKPHIVLSEDEHRIYGVQISNNQHGITISSEFSMPKNIGERPGIVFTKDCVALVVDYLRQTGAEDLVI